MAEIGLCSPLCVSFKCAKNSTIIRNEGTWCKWTEDMCNIANCTYAMCLKRRMLPKGVCGETIKRKTVEKRPDDLLGPPVKLKGRAFRKIGEREIF